MTIRETQLHHYFTLMVALSNRQKKKIKAQRRAERLAEAEQRAENFLKNQSAVRAFEDGKKELPREDNWLRNKNRQEWVKPIYTPVNGQPKVKK